MAHITPLTCAFLEGRCVVEHRRVSRVGAAGQGLDDLDGGPVDAHLGRAVVGHVASQVERVGVSAVRDRCIRDVWDLGLAN